jgi:hypothetical protein
MSVYSEWNRVTKVPSDDSWPDRSRSTLVNSPGETMRPLFRASLLERISVYSRTPPGLVVLSILWVVFVLGLVFGFTRLI